MGTGGAFECVGGGVESDGGYFDFGLFEEESGSAGFVVELSDLGEGFGSSLIGCLFHFTDIIIIPSRQRQSYKSVHLM